MTKVLARKPCCFRATLSLELGDGEKNLLDEFHGPRPARRLPVAPVVGLGGHRPRTVYFMVDRLSQ